MFQYGPIDGTEPAFSFRLDLESGDTVDGPVAGALCYLVIGSNTLTPDPDPEPITPSTPTGLRVRTPGRVGRSTGTMPATTPTRGRTSPPTCWTITFGMA